MHNTGIRRLKLATAALLALFLAACGSAPVSLPDRPGLPEAPAGQEITPLPEEGGDLPPAAYREDPLFAPVRAALTRGDWVAATLALPQPRLTGVAPAPAAEEEPDLAPWLTYYRARIALVRGDLAAYRGELQALGTPAGEALQRELLWHRLQRSLLAGDHRNSADLAYALYRAGGHPALSVEACETLLWQAVQSLAGPPAGSPPWRSWWTLSEAARLPSGREAVSALETWMGRHPEHPVLARAELLLSAALDDAQLESIALLIPLSGPLERAGDGIVSGALAAYFAQDNNRASVDILDSRRFQSMSDARDQALSQGADVLLGPLGKRQVAQLLAAQPQSIPLITLNRPETGEAIAAGTALQLSLAPEDEARQIAQRAHAAGARRALLVRPAGAWGERMERALLSGWRPIGGQLAARAEYGNPSTYSPVLEEALQLDRSAARSREMRQLFGESVESQGRRRQDLDVIFLLTRSADEARALKPLINYHYAGELPVYALSTADDGRAGLAASSDLEGLRLPVMPWRIGAAPPGLAAGGDAFASLHALGVDAYTLARLSHRLSSGLGLRYRGFTADLGVSADGVLLRELPMAEFDRGEITAR